MQVTLDMASRSLIAGPDEVSESLRINHELLNLPSIGVPDNKFFGANQLNIAPAEASISGIHSSQHRSYLSFTPFPRFYP